MKIKCCKDCPDRHPLCHGDCDRYNSEKKRYEMQKARIDKRKAEDRMFAAIRDESVRRTVRRKHHG